MEAVEGRLHHIQVQFSQSVEPKASRKSQKAPEVQDVRGDSFRTVLAKKSSASREETKERTSGSRKAPEKERQEQVNRKDVSSQKVDGRKKHHSLKMTADKGNVHSPKEKKNLHHKQPLQHVHVESGEKKNIKKGVKAEEKKGEKKKPAKKLPLQNAAVIREAGFVSASGTSGTGARLKTTAAEKKEAKDKKKASVKKVSGLQIKKTSGGLKLIDLRSRKAGKGKKVKNHHTQQKNQIIDSSKNTSGQNSSQNNQIRTAGFTPSVPSHMAEPQNFFSLSGDKAVLFKELQEKLNDRIVKESGIILKDNNTGEIKLILKPENLGKVRIRLHLQDNHLTGKIFVDNQQAQEVFQRNMLGLEKAFGDRGFSMTSLDVSVGDRERGNGRGGGERQVSRRSLEIIENAIPGTGENRYSDNIIDLVI